MQYSLKNPSNIIKYDRARSEQIYPVFFASPFLRCCLKFQTKFKDVICFDELIRLLLS